MLLKLLCLVLLLLLLQFLLYVVRKYLCIVIHQAQDLY